MAGSALLSAVVTLCNCSLANDAECFTTHKYSWPCTTMRSDAARTPGWLLLKDRKSTRLNSSHLVISYAVFCLKKKTQQQSIERCANIPSTLADVCVSAH